MSIVVEFHVKKPALPLVALIPTRSGFVVILFVPSKRSFAKNLYATLCLRREVYDTPTAKMPQNILNFGKKRSKSVDRSEGKVEKDILRTEEDARLLEYEAVIDTLTEKITKLEVSENAAQEKDILKENVLVTLENKIRFLKEQLNQKNQNEAILSQREIQRERERVREREEERERDLLRDRERLEQLQETDNLRREREREREDIEEKEKIRLRDWESRREAERDAERERERGRARWIERETEGVRSMADMERQIKYLSTELEGTKSQLTNKDDVIKQYQGQKSLSSAVNDPSSLLAARKLLKEVAGEFPKLSQEATHKFLAEAREFTSQYMGQWSREPLKMDVILSLIGASNPDKKTTIQRLKDEVNDTDSFLAAIALHYGDRKNYLVDEESFEARAPMGPYIQTLDYGAWIDNLRSLAERFLSHQSELEKERSILKHFVKNCSPQKVYEEVFTNFTKVPQEELDTPKKIRNFINSLKTIAEIKTLLAHRTKTANVRLMEQEQAPKNTKLCYTCGSAEHFSFNCNKQRQGYVPLSQRSAEDRKIYLESYNWSRPLCPQRRKNETCGQIVECSKNNYRHLLTNEEQKLRAANRLPLAGNPCSVTEALQEDGEI